MSEPAARLAAAVSDRYRLERELGQGGMATVYLAEDLKHDRKVAIKVLRPELAAVIGAERFLSEIRTTANLQHPHILPLFDSGAADSFLFYVMPFIEGESLRDRLNREKQLPINDAVRIATEVAGALDYAHRKGIIHRDIKPENILLHDGRALVADFGIALAASKAGGTRMTETGMSLGTPTYMSPEQAMGEREITARSDVYALGCVTYEMLVGDPPFLGGTAQAIVAKVMTEKPAPPSRMRDTIPPAVEDAVLVALAKLPADRQATAAEFAGALTGVGSTTRRPGGLAARELGGSGARRLGVRSAVTAILTVAGIAIGWGLGHRGSPAAEPLTVTSLLAPAGGVFAERRSLALSPDGRRLAFVFAAGDGSRMLWLRRLDRTDAEPIPHTSGADAPFWSPDGRTLGFFAEGGLMLLAANGDVRKLCPVTDPTGGSWATTGVILFGDRSGLSTVPAIGGGCTRIVPSDASSMLRGVFLPDGKRFLYSRGRSLEMVAATTDGTELATLPLRVEEFAIVAPDYVVTSSATEYRSLDAQRLNLKTLALEGPPVRIASGLRSSGGVHTMALSANGALAFLPSTIDRPYLEYDATGRLRDTVRVDGVWGLGVRPPGTGSPVVAVSGNAAGLWLYDLDADRATRLVVHDSLTGPAPRQAGPAFPVFDPHGTRLAYAVLGPGRCMLVERELATDTERIIVRDSTAMLNCLVPLDWSPDGRSLLLRWSTSLAILDLAGSQPRQDISRPGRLWDGRFAPDGRAVAYSSDETGRIEVYVQALPTGPARRVSLEGGRWPTWSHHGQLLSFLTPDGRVQQAAIGAGPDGAIGTPRTLFLVPTWRRALFDDRGTGFAMLGDGERYLVRQSPSGLAVTYVQHWQTQLRAADSAGTERTGP
ncbi:MAG: protein kinase [Gemmatimonadales bacterium]